MTAEREERFDIPSGRISKTATTFLQGVFIIFFYVTTPYEEINFIHVVPKIGYLFVEKGWSHVRLMIFLEQFCQTRTAKIESYCFRFMECSLCRKNNTNG